jgi:hypothetical protein
LGRWIVVRGWEISRFAIVALVAILPGAPFALCDADAVSKVYDSQMLNALPPRTEMRGVRVRGILRLTGLTDGPYLLQDMETYGLKAERNRHTVTVARSSRVLWFQERYEAALVIITGDYSKSGCREPDAICPHMKNELDPVSIEVISYPDKSVAEKVAEAGRHALRRVTKSDPHWLEIADMAERLVQAVRRRDFDAIRVLVDPGASVAGDPSFGVWLDEMLLPGGAVRWRLFDPESAFVSARHLQPAFRVYDTNEGPYGDEQRSVAICFDKGVRGDVEWPDSEFDLDAENVGDPYTCVHGFRTAHGWWLGV